MHSKAFKWLRFADMFDPSARLMLAAALLMFALLSIVNLSPLAWPLAILAGFLVYDTLRHASVWQAFAAFRAGNVAEVARLLAMVWWPGLLSPVSRAYYHWLRGVVEVSDGRFEAARVHLLVASTGTLKTENDRCLVQCLLTEVALQQGDREAAEKHLALANKLEHNNSVGSMINSLHARL